MLKKKARYGTGDLALALIFVYAIVSTGSTLVSLHKQHVTRTKDKEYNIAIKDAYLTCSRFTKKDRTVCDEIVLLAKEYK